MEKNRLKVDFVYTTPPAYFPSDYFEHRKGLDLQKGQVCADKNCQHCLAYKRLVLAEPEQ